MWKTIAYSILGLAGVLAVVAVISLATGTFQYLTAPFFGAVDAERKIESGGNRIYTYDHFFNLCSSVQSVEDKIDSQYRMLDRVNDEDRKDMIFTNITGLESRRSSLIREYNADARKAYTDARFLSDELPRKLPTDAYEQGDPKTSCEN
jgi:hypothetical protein